MSSPDPSAADTRRPYHSFSAGMNEAAGYLSACQRLREPPPGWRASPLLEAGHILLEQIERHREQDHVLQQEGNVARRRRKSRHRIPAVRHERDDRDCRDEGRGRAEGAEHTDPLVPEAGEQQRAEGPFRDTQEPAGTLVTEQRIEPPDQRAVADEGNEPLGLVGPPLLVTEEEEH